MREDGKTAVEISAALGRSIKSVYDAAKRLRMTTAQREFTSSEDALIRAAGASGVTNKLAQWRTLQKGSMPDRNIAALSRRYDQLLAATAKGDPPPPSGHTARKPALRFSLAEKEKIVKLRHQGMHWIDILKHLPGRTSSAAVQTLYHATVPKDSWVVVEPSNWWSQDERNRLKDLVDEGQCSEYIAKELNRPLRSVRERVKKLRGTEPVSKTYGAQKHWSKKELQELLQLDLDRQYTVQEMAEIMNRSTSSVRGQLEYLGARREVRLKRGAIEAVRAVEKLLELDAGGQHTQSEMAKVLDRSTDAVKQQLKRLQDRKEASSPQS